MADIDFEKYSNKKPYNNLPIPEGQHLAPFFVNDWDEVRQMNYHRDNLETWHFSGIGVLVAFTAVTEEQFPITMKIFWSKVRNHIASLGGDPNVISYEKMLDDLYSEDSKGYDPAQSDSLENTALLGLIIDDLIREVGLKNPRYGHILELIKQQFTKGEILDVILQEYNLKKTQAYSEIKAAQKLAKDLYYKD
jgi:hypothetical protein